MKNNIIYKVLLALILIMTLTFIGCAGGFLSDNDNANEFQNPLFHPEKVDTDTTDI